MGRFMFQKWIVGVRKGYCWEASVGVQREASWLEPVKGVGIEQRGGNHQGLRKRNRGDVEAEELPSVTPLRWGTGGSGPQGRSVSVTLTSRVGALCHVLLGGPVYPGQVHLCLGEVRSGRELGCAPLHLPMTLLWGVGGAGSLCGRSDTAGGPHP